MATESPAPYRLTLLGPWDLRGPTGKKVRSVLAQPKRLCLLAYLSLSGEPVSRATLVSLFWPDRDEERARNALSQSLHYLRRSLGPNVVESVEGDRVRVAPESIWFDARVLLEGTLPDDSAAGGSRSNGDGRMDSGGDRVAAASDRLSELARPVRNGRDFFQGWNADGSQPLQDWLDEVRRKVRERAEEVGGADGDQAGESERDAEAARGDGGVPAGRVGEAAAEGDGRSGRHGAGRAAWVWGGVALGILLTLGVLRLGPGPPAPVGTGADGDIPEVVVLFPRVTIVGEAPAFSAEAFAQALHDELVVRLGSVRSVRTVRIAFESEVFQLVRSLSAQGSGEFPEWVFSIRIRSGGDQVRVVALLLRGPDYTDAEIAKAGDYLVPAGAEALVDLPRQIALAMTVGMGEVVGGGS